MDHIKNDSFYDQLSLFEDVQRETTHFPGVTVHNFDGSQRILVFRKESLSPEYIYLAAPFTQFATMKESAFDTQDNVDIGSLFSGFHKDELYGELPSHYRKRLTKIEKAIEKHCGIPVLLPHRDINNWGKTSCSTEYLTPRIVRAVENSVALIAIPGCSIGFHLELEIAIARDIPIVVFNSSDFKKSFFLDGFAELPNVKFIQAPSLTKIPSLIETENISAFIRAVRGEKK